MCKHLTQNEKDFLADVSIIARACSCCGRNECPQWCVDFTRYQREELDEMLTSGNYSRVYSWGA